MNEEQVVDLLRAANPVPHHRDAIRVVRETDPPSRSIQVMLRDGGDIGHADVWPLPRPSQGREHMSEHDIATHTGSSRRWFAVADGCTSLGAVEVVGDSGYLATTSDRGLFGTRVFDFPSTDAAAELIGVIEQDIQDCDRAEHPLFVADLVSIDDVVTGDRAFVMTTENEGERECWVFVNGGPRIAVTLLTPGYYGDGQACIAVAEAWGTLLSDS